MKVDVPTFVSFLREVEHVGLVGDHVHASVVRALDDAHLEGVEDDRPSAGCVLVVGHKNERRQGTAPQLADDVADVLQVILIVEAEPRKVVRNWVESVHLGLVRVSEQKCHTRRGEKKR